ncbi:MAG TPA: Hsp20/alpha crystallin family protein [Pirellulales bacterium]|nr:Hsp20/alpha crystallin family protein [Pirellulales bacterium]
MVRWRTNGGFPFWQLRGEFERAMSDFLTRSATASTRSQDRLFPAVNVWEEGDQLFAEAELPGVKGEDLDVSVTGDELTLRGRRSVTSGEGQSYHRRERSAGEFSRTLHLPYEVDANGVEATLRDGVLFLKLPKAASARPRKIEIRSGGNQ